MTKGEGDALCDTAYLCSVTRGDGDAPVSSGERDLLYGVVCQLLESITCLPQQALRLRSLNTNCVTIVNTGTVSYYGLLH